MNRDEARSEIDTWVKVELVKYADPQKWDHDDAMHTTWDEDNGDTWEEFVGAYLHRAALLGWTNPNGQQALLKALVTLFEMCVTMMIGCDGDVPQPGHSSGEIVPRNVGLGA